MILVQSEYKPFDIDTVLYYFAYGSNLHPVRLQQRVASAELVGTSEIKNHRLVFHKQGRDSSGKADMLISGRHEDSVFGAIYRISRDHKALLDGFEGCGNGYIDREISVHHRDRHYTCFTYTAQESHIVPGLRPYHWYKDLVVIGARHLDFPQHYIQMLETVESVDDSHALRKQQHESLVEIIRAKAVS